MPFLYVSKMRNGERKNLFFSPQEMSQTLISPVLADYITQFIQILTSHEEADSDPGLRKEVILALSNLIRCYPSTLLPHLLSLVTPVWNILVSSTDL